MILSTHALTGAVIGKNIENPYLVITLALVFHYLMDSLRHGEYFDSRIANIKNTWWKVALDIVFPFAIVISYFYFNAPEHRQTGNIILGMFFSMFPDGLTLIHWKFPKNRLLKSIKKFHGICHRYDKFPQFSTERQWTLRNARNDILISLLAIGLLFLF